jgi:hypothetical protein
LMLGFRALLGLSAMQTVPLRGLESPVRDRIWGVTRSSGADFP